MLYISKMKTFTLKDFVAYNSPCFGCGELITFQIGVQPNDPVISFEIVYLKTNVQKDFTAIDLHIGWNDTLILNIDHKTNKFSTNNIFALTKYLKEHKLLLKCDCNKCHTYALSNYLEFNLEKKFIKTVGLSREITIMHDNVNMYQVYSHYYDNNTVIFIDRLDKATPISPIRLDTPLIMRSKFKNKDQLIQKIKIYTTFS